MTQRLCFIPFYNTDGLRPFINRNSDFKKTKKRIETRLEELGATAIQVGDLGQKSIWERLKTNMTRDWVGDIFGHTRIKNVGFVSYKSKKPLCADLERLLKKEGFEFNGGVRSFKDFWDDIEEIALDEGDDVDDLELNKNKIKLKKLLTSKHSKSKSAKSRTRKGKRKAKRSTRRRARVNKFPTSLQR